MFFKSFSWTRSQFPAHLNGFVGAPCRVWWDMCWFLTLHVNTLNWNALKADQHLFLYNSRFMLCSAASPYTVCKRKNPICFLLCCIAARQTWQSSMRQSSVLFWKSECISAMVDDVYCEFHLQMFFNRNNSLWIRCLLLHCLIMQPFFSAACFHGFFPCHYMLWQECRQCMLLMFICKGFCKQRICIVCIL